jgi:nitrogen fixation/metabolism regulation signal transduction histidine kinase
MKRREVSHEGKAVLLALLAAGPAILVALALLWTGDHTPKVEWTLTVLIVTAWFGGAMALRDHLSRPLQTLANLLGALREDDFSIRGRHSRPDDSLGQAYAEVNALAGTLQAQRTGAIEATALLGKVMAEIDVAIYAFDAKREMVLHNRAGARLLERVTQDQVAALLDGETPRTVEVAGGQWELRRGAFRQKGLPLELVVLTDLRRALREEERQAWQRLVRVLGHEINNSLAPIRSITGNLRETLSREPRPPHWEEDVSRGLQVVERRAEALGRFMTSYARLARLPPPRLGPVEVSGWVRRAVDLEKRIPIQLAAGPDATIFGDGDQLDQVLINLLQNAVEASQETGGGVAVTWRRASPWLEVVISDEGPGIGDTANLFVPFFTTKAQGSGIGLVLSRQIAEAHHGTLSLANRSDRRGCEARLRLPL